MAKIIARVVSWDHDLQLRVAGSFHRVVNSNERISKHLKWTEFVIFTVKKNAKKLHSMQIIFSVTHN